MVVQCGNGHENAGEEALEEPQERKGPAMDDAGTPEQDKKQSSAAGAAPASATQTAEVLKSSEAGLVTTAAPKVKRRPVMMPILVLEPVRWPPLRLAAEVEAAAAMLRDRSSGKLRILTWNVWFDSLCAPERQAALMREVLAAAPDVICLQEVLKEFLEALRGCHELCEVYEISPQDVGTYGCVMLVRRDLRPMFQEQLLPSQMGRCLLSAECTDRCPGLYIVTTHLESLNNRDRRETQLRCAAAALADHPLSLICGDFNFDETKTWGEWKSDFKPRPTDKLGIENDILKEVLPSYSDTWRKVWPEEPGYTFDGLENGVCIQDSKERMRYDRVLTNDEHLKPTAAVICGRDAINDWGVLPSDHFGLSVDMDICGL